MDAYRAFRDETLSGILTDAFANRSARLLEVGCGTGLSLRHLARTSKSFALFGMDASETMLRHAAQNASDVNTPLKLSLGDALKLPFADEQFDVVLATRFIHQFGHDVKQQLWSEFRRVTRRGGVLIVEFYARPYHWIRFHSRARKGRSREAYFLHYPSRAEVREIVGDHFDLYPLRLAGSRVITRLVGPAAARRITSRLGTLGGGVLLDEYFVVARK
jgi:ubiquinone/menaquinone biosynthesis C-methylase UbiE